MIQKNLAISTRSVFLNDRVSYTGYYQKQYEKLNEILLKIISLSQALTQHRISNYLIGIDLTKLNEI
jgi:hypothetical protein